MNENTSETRTNIIHTFLRLMNEKGIDSVTVMEIAEQAKVSRGTFYLHFLDKYDVLEKIESDLLDQLTLKFDEILLNFHQYIPTIKRGEVTGLSFILTETLQYIDTHSYYFKVLLSENGDPSFYKKMMSVYTYFYKSALQNLDLNYKIDFVDKAYTDQFIISGIVNTILYWLENDTKASYEDIALFLKKTRIIPPVELMGME